MSCWFDSRWMRRCVRGGVQSGVASSVLWTSVLSVLVFAVLLRSSNALSSHVPPPP